MTFSKAEIIQALGPKGQPFIFTNGGDGITQQARGTYNFAPVRDPNTRQTVGYSFTDEHTVHIPKADFWGPGKAFWGVPQNDHLESFLGQPIAAVLATPAQHKTAAKLLSKPRLSLFDKALQYRLRDKVFDLHAVLSPSIIQAKDLSLYAKYVDITGQLVFNTNDKGEVYFPKASCELDRNSRPSVFPMHGSCFALVTAIAQAIQQTGTTQVKPIRYTA